MIQLREQEGRVLHQIKNLLLLQDLRWGRNRIFPLSTPSKGEAPPLSLFGATTSTLNGSRTDLIAVPDPSLVADGGELISEMNRSLGETAQFQFQNVVCILPDEGFVPAGSVTKGGKPVTWLKPTDFFDTLVSMPSDFHNLLERVSWPDDPNNLLLYQGRSATIRSDPEGRFPPGYQIDSLDAYLREWSVTASDRQPILLLGERGSGKTWQLLRFCQGQYQRHMKSRWGFGPAFMVKLRSLKGYEEHSPSGLPFLAQYLLSRYQGLSFYNDFGLLSALLSSGNLIICFDGFDEVEIQPSDARVQQNLSLLMSVLPTGARFIVSSRTSHFTSFGDLLRLETWPGQTVEGTFQIIELQPFDRQIDTYISAVRDVSGQPAVADELDALINSGDTSLSPGLQRAFRAAAKHPGLLAEIRQRIEQSSSGSMAINPMAVLKSVIEDGLVRYNILKERTLAAYDVDEKHITAPTDTDERGFIDLGPERRLSICEEIAWLLAERGQDSFDISRMTNRLRLQYGISGDVLERDLRSQTIFELVEVVPENSNTVETPPEKQEVNSEAGESRIQFTLRVEPSSSRTVTASSVTGAFFTARYLLQRLEEVGPVDELPIENKLRRLGRIPLGEMAGSMLRELLAIEGRPETQTLVPSALQATASLTAKRDLSIFSPWYRYLFPNLVDMGLMNRCDAQHVDPWAAGVSEVLRPPVRLSNYPMVLVPGDEPFLIGVHEVTNRNYEQFVFSAGGWEWSVERMTRAASGLPDPPSPYAGLSNEYHLYFWEKQVYDGREAFRPPRSLLDHPVAWVSWYAAAALCDWLSGVEESMFSIYQIHLEPTPGYEKREKGRRTGFRLPTSREWKMAAEAGHSDLEYPWEMFPYYLPKSMREICLREFREGASPGTDEQALTRYIKYQAVMKSLLIGSSRESREVMYDEFNDFGLSGLFGNVKEWCEDYVPAQETCESKANEDERLGSILGASGYLDEKSFRFTYSAPLFRENTNPDVGFRVARSLSEEELSLLRRREQEIGDAAMRLLGEKRALALGD